MGWRPTATLARAIGATTVALALGLVTGKPALVVFAVPFAVHAALALAHRPRALPTARVRWDSPTVTEGQSTRLLAHLEDVDVEDATWVVRSSDHLVAEPKALSAGPDAFVSVAARRWGHHEPASTAYLATGRWGGFCVGPTAVGAGRLQVLPAAMSYDTSAPLPRPVGLVGAHASHRTGTGVEFQQTRAFATGDRLRRINWRVSSRTPTLQVDTTSTEDDASVLLVVDLLTDVAPTDRGAASSSDLGVRAAATLAGHHLALGDRVSLRVLASATATVRPGSGRRHLRRIQSVLAGSVPGSGERGMPPLRTPPGTTIILFSPLLVTTLTDTLGDLLAHGWTLIVVDTLPESPRPPAASGTDPELAALAWRMRALDRAEIVTALERTGTRVVPWRGPGSLDAVLRQLARQPARMRR